jgi:hypothetical protein
MAIFDWRTPGQAKVYTDAADRKRRAGKGMGLLDADRNENADCRTENSGSVAPEENPGLNPPGWQEWRACQKPIKSTWCNEILALFDPRKYWRSHKIVTPFLPPKWSPIWLIFQLAFSLPVGHTDGANIVGWGLVKGPPWRTRRYARRRNP